MQIIEHQNQELSIRQQCDLLSLHRSNLYYQEAPIDPSDITAMHLIDAIFTQYSFFGYRRITALLNQNGHRINAKRVLRLMGEMGIEAIYPKKKTTVVSLEHLKYPYLLRDVDITHVNQVWSTDITYIPMREGYLYLMAIIDWHSRYVLSWSLSTTLHSDFCVTSLKSAMEKYPHPKIFNTDQGCQFTSRVFTSVFDNTEVKISMDGKGRCHDNIFVERLWRSVKYEEVYLKDYSDGYDAEKSLRDYFEFYNEIRPHQSLGYRTPKQIYHGLFGALPQSPGYLTR